MGITRLHELESRQLEMAANMTSTEVWEPFLANVKKVRGRGHNVISRLKSIQARALWDRVHPAGGHFPHVGKGRPVVVVGGMCSGKSIAAATIAKMLAHNQQVVVSSMGLRPELLGQPQIFHDEAQLVIGKKQEL
mgnify:CR=1 FL=1